MNYSIKKEITKPAYIQIYEQLKEDILHNVFPYQTKLPSKRLLAEELNVSIITVEHAYALLIEEGYVEAKERSGYFILFRPADGFVQYTEKAIHPIPLNPQSDQKQFPFSVLSKTMRKVINEYGERLLEKSENKGCFELRNAICHYLRKNRGMHIHTKQIIIGSGAEYLYHLIVEMLGRDKTYAIEAPSYEKIQQVYEASNVNLTFLPFEKDGIQSEALKNTCADVLHISPYRSFPTGITASASKRYEYIRWAEQANRYIIEDDFESEFSISRKMEDTLFACTDKENVIYLNTFSKTISPALRIGYMVLPLPLVEIFQKRLGFYSCTVPTFEQLVLATLLTSGDFERHINRVRRNARKALNNMQKKT